VTKPAQVVRAVATERRVISPFQYYTEASESIYRLKYADDQLNGSLYLHYDAKGRFLTRAAEGQESIRRELLRMVVPEKEILDCAAAGECGFEVLLADMHKATPGGGEDFYEPEDLEHILSITSKSGVVIGGCGRSGTTLLLSILGAHPAIFAVPDETYAFYPRPMRLKRLVDSLRHSERDIHSLRWCEKTPKNVQAFGEILSLFHGRVRLIHMVRDGRDVVTSVHPTNPNGYWVSTERWVTDVSTGLEYSEQALQVRYEDLVIDPETELRRICEFIEEPFSRRLVEHTLHTSVDRNPAWGKALAQPIEEGRTGRWQSPEHSEVIADFASNRQASILMERLGYS
jgi:hypothetical protein